jgi:hypothetical protein
MLFVGSATAIGLALLDTPLALTIGVIAGVLAFIPFFGPIASGLLAVLLAFMQGPTQALYVDLEQKIVAVEAKPGQSLDLARVNAEITDAGYSISKTETVSQSVEQIRAELRKAKK